MRILGMSSFIPEHICDVIKFDGYKGDNSISHYCGYVADYISQVLNDSSIDGAVYPKSCDSSRVISSYLEGTQKFLHQIHVPARQDSIAVGMFGESIKSYKESVEKAYDILIDDDMIGRRCEIIEDRNSRLKKIYDDLGNISFADYLQLLHMIQGTPLKKQLECIGENKLKKQSGKGKRIYLVGSRITNMSVVRDIEKSGMTIVGDNVTESKRMFTQGEIYGTGDIYQKISESILKSRLSPTQNNYEEIITGDVAEIKEKEIDGVIFLTQKYCEPYDYLFSVYKKVLDGMDIPTLRLSISGTTDAAGCKLRVEAFCDMI